MKVQLQDIKPEGLDVHYQIPAEDIGLTDQDYLQFIKPIDIHAHLERVNNTVLCKTRVQSRYKSFCSRTLIDVQRDWQHEFILHFSVDSAKDFIDIDEDIRQEMILGIPLKVLSDQEMEKDLKDKQPQKVTIEPSDGGETYQPFANLRLKEEQ